MKFAGKRRMFYVVLKRNTVAKDIMFVKKNSNEKNMHLYGNLSACGLNPLGYRKSRSVGPAYVFFGNI